MSLDLYFLCCGVCINIFVCVSLCLLVDLFDGVNIHIAIMKLIKHPNVVQMYEVLASKTKIFIVLELVRGGELFDQIGLCTKLPSPL